MGTFRDAGARTALRTRSKRSNPAQARPWPDEAQQIRQRRFYDFNVWSARKRAEKLRHTHRKPVKEGLVQEPEQWQWSRYRSYAYEEQGKVRIRSSVTRITDKQWLGASNSDDW